MPDVPLLESNTSHIVDLIVEFLRFHEYGRTLEVRTVLLDPEVPAVIVEGLMVALVQLAWPTCRNQGADIREKGKEEAAIHIHL